MSRVGTRSLRSGVSEEARTPRLEPAGLHTAGLGVGLSGPVLSLLVRAGVAGRLSAAVTSSCSACLRGGHTYPPPHPALVLCRNQAGGGFCKSSFNRAVSSQLDGQDGGRWPLARRTSTPKCSELWAGGSRSKLAAGPFLGRGLLSSLSLPLCAASPCPGPGAASGCPRGLHPSALRPASNPTPGFSSGPRAMCLSSWVSWVLANGFY